MNTLELELKAMIVEVLGLEDIRPEDIDSEAPLFGAGLGLDSIDALELGVALRKKYQLRLEAKDPDNRRHFGSVRALATFIQSREPGGQA